MPNETLPSAPARADDTSTGEATVHSAPSVRECVPRCPPELAALIDALLDPAGVRPTREQAVAVLARLYPSPEKPHVSPEWRARLDDWKWIDDGYSTGAWDAYAGNHIVVHQQRLIAFGPDLIELRARVAREYGLAPNDLAVSYVEPPPLG